MAPRMAILFKTRAFIKTLNPNSLRTISTFPILSQEPQLESSSSTIPLSSTPLPEESSSSSTTIPSPSTPLPANPATGSPLYQENWRNPVPNVGFSQSLVPFGMLQQTSSARIQALSLTLDVGALMNVFADWMTSQRWVEIQQLFECWIKCLDKSGKPNHPDVNLYNHYLRAKLMAGSSAGELLDLVAQMEDYKIMPNTASFNLVLKGMYQARETEAAEKLLQRMLQTGKESMPNDESYDLVIGMLFAINQIDPALKYLDMTLRSGHMVSMRMFTECVRSCVTLGRLDTLASIIERCKTMDQNKALCPSWNLCNYIADVALQEDNSKLAFYALEFLNKLMARSENARPAAFLSVDEGLVVAALGTAGRTYSSTLLDASWATLRRSLREKTAPSAESFLGKIFAYASLGNLQKAFSTLHELESASVNFTTGNKEELLSPFTSLNPLVLACSKKGFETLDLVYFQLENLRCVDPPYKSLAALNCIILGCANIWDLERAYQTFESISGTFELTPDIHSYNALMCAFGKLKKAAEASNVLEHLTSLGVKPNATSYQMLVNAHIINNDQKAALSVVDEMVIAGFIPSKDILKNIRRRCVREFDYESNDQVDSIARKFNIRMGTENRRDMLFNLKYGTGYP